MKTKSLLAAAALLLLAAPPAHAQSLQDQQASCKAQADKVFEPFNAQWRASSTRPSLADAPYHFSYYNKNLGVCLVSIITHPEGFKSDQWEVRDAFGGRVFASYSWSNFTHRKYWEVPPTTCWTAFTGETKHCNSEDEFSEAVMAYFNK
jgi:hypothetical protein